MPYVTYNEYKRDGDDIISVTFANFSQTVVERLKIALDSLTEEFQAVDALSVVGGDSHHADFPKYTKAWFLEQFKKEYNKKPEWGGGDKINMIKIVRAASKNDTGEVMGLREAKELVESVFEGDWKSGY